MEKKILKTGLTRLDTREYGGIQKGELTMLYARVGEGRTAFLCNVFLNMIAGQKCLFFVFEEPERRLFERMACIKSGRSYWQHFYGNDFEEGEKQDFAEAEEWLEGKLCSESSNSRIIDKAHSLADVLLYVAEAKATKGLDAVFIDGLRHLKVYAEEETRYVVRMLKEIAVRLDIAVFATNFLPRCKAKVPTVKDVKNKFVVQTADKIMILEKPLRLTPYEELTDGEEAMERTANLYIVKNYTGLQGCIPLSFEKTAMRFSDYDEDEIDWD